MLDLLFEAMPRPHVAKQDVADLSRLVLIEPVHRPPPAVEGPEGALGGLSPGLRPQPLELFWRRPAIPNRVLEPHVSSSMQPAPVGLPANEIKPVTKVKVDFSALRV